VIRFWDTSALVKVYSAAEVGHHEAVRLLHGPRARPLRHATSMLVAVELVSALVRRLGASDLATLALHQLESFSQMEMSERHRDLGTRLARTGIARGPDTAIAAQALVLAAVSGARLEFITADALQARLIRSHAKAHDLDIRVVALAA
jgi:predicted nucleic acid-binding protein